MHRHEGNGGDVWTLDTVRGTMSKLTFDASQENIMPIWSPDAASIVFASRRNDKWGLYRKRSDGTGADELLFESDLVKYPWSWSPDGKFIVFGMTDPKSVQDLWLLPLSDRKPTPLLNSPYTEMFAAHHRDLELDRAVDRNKVISIQDYLTEIRHNGVSTLLHACPAHAREVNCPYEIRNAQSALRRQAHRARRTVRNSCECAIGSYCARPWNS